MNILVLNWRDGRHPQAGGAEAYVHEIGSRWAAQGHRVVLIAAHPTPAPRTQHEYRGISVVRVGGRYTVYLAARHEYLQRWRGWADVVLEHINGVPFLAPMYAGKPVVAVVYHVVGRVFFQEVPWPLAILGYSAERALPAFYRRTPVVTISPSTKVQLGRLGFRESQMHVVPIGVNLPANASLNGDRQDQVLVLGRLKQYKRLDLIVRAASLVRREIPDVQFLVAGAGDYEAEMRQLVRALELQRNVHLLGHVSETEKAELLRTSKILAVASEREGWGLNTIEAAGYGTPTVGLDAPGVRDSIIDGQTGLLVSRRSSESLASGILQLLHDERQRQKLGAQAIEYAKRFSWDASATQLLEILTTAA